MARVFDYPTSLEEERIRQMHIATSYFKDDRIVAKKMEIIDGNVYECSYNKYGELLNKAFCYSAMLDTILGVPTSEADHNIKHKNKKLLLLCH